VFHRAWGQRVYDGNSDPGWRRQGFRHCDQGNALCRYRGALSAEPASSRSGRLHGRAHLPRLPRPLGGPSDVWAECVFANPVTDLAVLCEPDNQALSDQADAYRQLTEAATPFALGRLRFSHPRRGLPFDPAFSDAKMLSLDGEWFACRITSYGRVLSVEAPTQQIEDGSGSPIIRPDGSATGVLCIGSERDGGGPNPLLFDQLPAWLARTAL
jgi:hypothetical protein